jgi:hypothetical protein
VTKLSRSETPLAYYPPADEQIVVWADDQGAPMVHAIFDKIIEPSSATERYSYQAFVREFGPRAAEAAVQLYRMEHD